MSLLGKTWTRNTVAQARAAGRLVEAMVDALVDAHAATGGVTRDDLRERGFSEPEIARHGVAAVARARKICADRDDAPLAEAA